MQKISCLPISSDAKHYLYELGLYYTDSLLEHNYFSLKEISHNYSQTVCVTRELIPLGYLLSPLNELCIYDISMSTRLFNILTKHEVFYLSELSNYSYENIFQFRNMGHKTYYELKNLCNRYNVSLKSPVTIPSSLKGIGLSTMFLSECSQKGILSLTDLNGISTQALYQLCNKSYTLTMNTYFSLLKHNIVFTEWTDSFLFEHLTPCFSLRLWEQLRLENMSQLLSLDSEKLLSIHGIGQKKINELETLRLSFFK